MEGPPRFVARECCPAGRGRFIERVDVERSLAYPMTRTEAPILEVVEPSPPDERTAFHEAGHAVFAHAMGADIDVVTIADPAHVASVATAANTATQRIARRYAGHVGEMIRMRCFGTVSPDDEADFLCRVEAFQFGGCDGCQMAMAAWLEVGFSAGIEAARGVFRAGQLLALRLGGRRDIQQAVRALAAELMNTPTISGKRAHSVVEPLVRFGSLQEDTLTC